MSNWKFQTVDNSQLTTISDLTAHVIYTIRVQALTSVGPGPLSAPVQIKTQQGVPSQPEKLTAVDIGETKISLSWNKPSHSAENILSYELYWNDTYAKVFPFNLPQPLFYIDLPRSQTTFSTVCRRSTIVKYP